MPEYIEREELLKEIYHRARLSSVGETTTPYLDWKEIVSVIKDTPAADVVEVVRCKDCKYGHLRDNTKRNSSIYCDFGIGVHKENYCSFGERAEE